MSTIGATSGCAKAELLLGEGDGGESDASVASSTSSDPDDVPSATGGGAGGMNVGGAGAGGMNAGGAGGAGSGGKNETGPTHVPVCTPSCVTLDDCTTYGVAIYGPDNWACDAGVCEYLGCKSDGECLEAHNDPAWACRSAPGDAVPHCYPKCDIDEDCATPGEPLDGPDNWACDAGVCEHLGCQSDGECRDANHDPNWFCRSAPGDAVPRCYLKCTTTDDCATPEEPLDGPDNWACNEGVCEHLGCKSDGECVETLSDPDYVCD